MDRGNSKHGPRLDEEMAFETLGMQQGEVSGQGRVEEWREPEPSGEDQPEEGLLQATGEDGEPDRDARSTLGTFLRRTAFPADGPALAEVAQQAHAPDEIVADLTRLPAGQTYGTVSEVWVALGHNFDHRF